ncbi:methionine biosynthesis protein MetW [Candidatus Desantisbacteria bacterium CG1_02_49_89]|nr:MAG: methionine biosynthesis protein MetW [Candidatus Desantisbacteria bacterium CG1_02_49_89]
MRYNSAGPEQKIIFELVKPGSSVLDLGCGDGELLSLLAREKKVKGQGIEINEKSIHECVAKGLNVFHGDIDSGLSDYRDKSFDYVILNHSLQEAKKPEVVLREALRAGRKAIVSFPNFAHYSARLQIFFRGKTPVTPSLPHRWYDTPNLHFLSISDFAEYCRERNIMIEKSLFIGKNKAVYIFPNLFALAGIFLIANGKPGKFLMKKEDV